jgi:peptidyl-prolyl cis-trans isomerase C
MTETTPTSGCSLKSRNLPRPKDISVNGVRIDRAAIAREAQNHPASKPVEAWLAAARALVVRELLLQEARRLRIAAEPLGDEEGRRETEEEALIRCLVEQEVHTPKADEAECRRYYEQNQVRFRSPDIIEVRHILCAADPKDLTARHKARARAEAAIATLAAAPERFDDLAAELSACPSARMGGSLGQITRGQTVPEFEAALQRLPPGQIAPHPIETRYGFHVVWVDRRVDGQQLPFEAVGEHIAAWLEEKVQRTAMRQYIAGLAGRAAICGIALEASNSPLVQ